MKVLILGASGLLGTSIIKSFKQKKKLFNFQFLEKNQEIYFQKIKIFIQFIVKI
jgi:dTDP-4-dehydrorhamnose reductase